MNLTLKCSYPAGMQWHYSHWMSLAKLGSVDHHPKYGSKMFKTKEYVKHCETIHQTRGSCCLVVHVCPRECLPNIFKTWEGTIYGNTFPSGTPQRWVPTIPKWSSVAWHLGSFTKKNHSSRRKPPLWIPLVGRRGRRGRLNLVRFVTFKYFGSFGISWSSSPRRAWKTWLQITEVCPWYYLWRLRKEPPTNIFEMSSSDHFDLFGGY